MKNIILTVAALLSLGFISEVQSQSIFIKFSNIEGQSQDTHHDKWSEVSGVERGGVSRPYNASVSSFSSADQGTITVEMTRDKSWGKLVGALHNRTVFSAVEIEYVKSGTSTNEPFMKTQLEVASIQSISHGDDPGTIEVVLKAQIVKHGYKSQNQQGEFGSAIIFGFNYNTQMEDSSITGFD